MRVDDLNDFRQSFCARKRYNVVQFEQPALFLGQQKVVVRPPHHHLQRRGVRGLGDTIALVKIKTWQFARRQRTWFRRQLAVEWVPVLPQSEPAAVARELADRIAARSPVAPLD